MQLFFRWQAYELNFLNQTVPHPNAFCYRLNGMSAQKKFQFFSCIICVKTKWNSLRILRNKNLSNRHKYFYLNASNISYFRTISTHHREFWVLLNNPITNFNKTVFIKNVWMRKNETFSNFQKLKIFSEINIIKGYF